MLFYLRESVRNLNFLRIFDENSRTFSAMYYIFFKERYFVKHIVQKFDTYRRIKRTILRYSWRHRFLEETSRPRHHDNLFSIFSSFFTLFTGRKLLQYVCKCIIHHSRWIFCIFFIFSLFIFMKFRISRNCTIYPAFFTLFIVFFVGFFMIKCLNSKFAVESQR